MAHVAKWKTEEVKELSKLIDDYPVIGVVNVGAVPGKQIQKIRASVRGDTMVRMSRKRLMKLAIQKASKEGVSSLEDHIDGQAGLLFSRSNPFKIYKTLEKNKTKAPVKANSIAPSDISVQKGDTPFPPGPILSELQQGGIPAAIQGGKVVIKQDKLLVKEGEKVSAALANALAKLEIEPLEIKLDLVAAFEDGFIYTSDVLAVDSEKLKNDIMAAYQGAVNLSLNSHYLTKETAPMAISMAAGKARNLAINANIYEKEVINEIIASAQAKALAVASFVKDAEKD